MLINMVNDKMYVLSADMGYGHQRAAYPFKDLAQNGVMVLNNYPGIASWEKATWTNERKEYEFISYFKRIPFFGDLVFKAMDAFQKIEPFYPHRDLSKPTLQQKFYLNKIKKGLGNNLIKILNQKPLPLLTTFFVGAYCADYYNYHQEVYCVVCDADISRAWAPLDPQNSKVIYLAPNQRVKERLLLYGVRDDKIYVTGFPLPKENVGENQEIVRADLRKRLAVLDPSGDYREKYQELLQSYLGDVKVTDQADRVFTLTFAVGGAGAQRDLGRIIVEKLKVKIRDRKIILNLVAGNRRDVYDYFVEVLKRHDLQDYVRIIFNPDKFSYFAEFNQILRTTDILWTKPSELSFYAGLGLPIIMTEPIGSQEDYNRRWLLGVGAGMDSKNPEYVDEWLFDFLNSGWLAEAAVNGFMDGPKMGTYNIENLILRHQIQEIDGGRLM